MFCDNWTHQWDDLMTADTIKVLEDIENNLPDSVYYPKKENVLRFLQMETPVKVVIVGMDPYPSFNERDGIPQATGRSFEVSELFGQTWEYKIKQSSLRNMLKSVYFNETKDECSMEELRNKISSEEFKIAPPTEWFDNLEKQGVLFLNSTLTVKPGKAGSHKKYWEPFRKILIPYLESQGVTWMLWGNNARDEVGEYLSDNSKVLLATHPRMPDFVKTNTFQFVKDIDWKGLS